MKKSILFLVVLVLVAGGVWVVLTMTNPGFFPFGPGVSDNLGADDDNNAQTPPDEDVGSGDVVEGDEEDGIQSGAVLDNAVSGDVIDAEDGGDDTVEPFDPTESTDPEVEEIINILEELIAEAEQGE